MPDGFLHHPIPVQKLVDGGAAEVQRRGQGGEGEHGRHQNHRQEQPLKGVGGDGEFHLQQPHQQQHEALVDEEAQDNARRQAAGPEDQGFQHEEGENIAPGHP